MRRFLTLWLLAGLAPLAGLPGKARAAVTLDSAEPASATTSSLVFSHTCSGSNLLLVVGVCSDNGASVTSATYGAQGLVLVTRTTQAQDNRVAEVWALRDPSPGTADVTLNLSSSQDVVAGAASYRGVDAFSPVGAVGVSQEASAAAVTASVTTQYANSLIASFTYANPPVTNGGADWVTYTAAATFGEYETDYPSGVGAGTFVAIGQHFTTHVNCLEQLVEIGPLGAITPTSTITPTDTASPSATPTPSPSATATASPTATPSPTPTATGTDTASPSSTATATGTGTATASPSPSPSASPTGTPLPSLCVYTYAGNGTGTFGGDNGPAPLAGVYGPEGGAVDSSGDLFIADLGNNRIREVNPAGVITTVAGGGSGGDGGPATAASLRGPVAVVLDASGDLFFTDSVDNRVREVDASSGLIRTVAGNGSAAFSGDGGPASLAGLNSPQGLARDAAGNLYIADQNNNRVREVDASSGLIRTVAGNGSAAFSGDGGPATSAGLDGPAGVAVDSAGNLFISDTGNNRVREVLAGSGAIVTVAGDGTASFGGDGGPATAAGLDTPLGLALDSASDLFIADASNNRVREIPSGSGLIFTVAGDGAGSWGGDFGPATAAQFSHPSGLCLDASGSLYVGDRYNDRVRKVMGCALVPTPTGTPTRTPSFTDSPTATASATPTPSATATSTPTASATPTLSASPSPTASVTATFSASPSVTRTFTVSDTPTISPTPLHPGAIPGRVYSYPNPFRPNQQGQVTFVFQDSSRASLEIYDFAARLVCTVPQGRVHAGQGYALWDGRDGSGHVLPQGLYFVLVKRDGGNVSGKFTILW